MIEAKAVYLVVLPLLGGFLMWFASQLGQRGAKVFALVISLWTLYKAVLVDKFVLANGPFAVVFSGWGPPLGINFFVDAVSAAFVLFATLLTAIVVLVSPYKKYSWRFFGLLMLMLASLNGLILSADVFNIFVFFEILCLVSFALVAYYRGREAIEAGIKYFILGSIASALFLIAIALVYGASGALNLADLSLISTQWAPAFKSLLFILFLLGIGVESGIFPLNAWLFDAHPAAPYPVSAMLSGVVIESALYVLVRLNKLVFPEVYFSSTLLLLGLITFFVAEVVGFYQKDVKRALAYSSAGQIGLMMMAFSFSGKWGILAGMALFLNHLLAKSGLFIATGISAERNASRRIDEFARENSFAEKVLVVLSGLSLLGVPISLGFVGKVMLFYLLVSGGFYIAVGVMVVALVLEALYILRIVGWTMKGSGQGKLECPGQWLGMWALSILLVVVPVKMLVKYKQGILDKAVEKVSLKASSLVDVVYSSEGDKVDG